MKKILSYLSIFIFFFHRIFLVKNWMINIDHSMEQESASYYCEQILKIPMPSGEESKIAEYLINFAEFQNMI